MLDKWIVDKIDAGASWLQRRGASLVMMHCWAMASVLISDFGFYAAKGFGIVSMIFVCLWGGVLWRYVQWAKPNVGYRDDYRLTQRLNAQVLIDREKGHIWRYGMIGMVTFEPLVIWSFFVEYGLDVAILDMVRVAAIFIVIYLNTSTFISTGLMNRKSEPAIGVALKSETP